MQLKDLQSVGIIKDSLPELVNAASIDIRLGRVVLLELPLYHSVSLRHREPVRMREHDLLVDGPIVLNPGQFMLAHSMETFNLPNHISAEYKLKSSMARIGLDHLNAGWCDAGWHGSVLTLELKNVSNYASITLHYEDKIGQMVFLQHEEVPASNSYASKGRYNLNTSVSGARPDPKHAAIFDDKGEDITEDEQANSPENDPLYTEFLAFKKYMTTLQETELDEVLDEDKVRGEAKTVWGSEERMDIIGQNGNEGIHYDADTNNNGEEK